MQYAIELSIHISMDTFLINHLMVCSCYPVIYVNLKYAHYIHSNHYLEAEIILFCF